MKYMTQTAQPIRFLALISIFLFSFTFSQAQEVITKKDAPKKAMKLLSKLDKSSMTKNPDKALKHIAKILKKYPGFVDVYMEKAFLFYKLDRLQEAKSMVEKAIELKPDYKADHYLILANYCLALEELECEKENLTKYLEFDINQKRRLKVESRLEGIKFKEKISQNYEKIDLEKLSDHINTSQYAEYKPVMNVEETEIIFTRRINGQEDFYRSIREDSSWTKAQPIRSLNTPGNEGAHAVSPDGKWMVYTRCDVPKRYRSCDLYISKLSEGQWTDPIFMDIVNTHSYESQASFSPDGNIIYFTSNRKGGHGGKDLYFIERKDGKWLSPKNMGAKLNTPGNEESPFMHPDGRTLYFMSNGHQGFGGQDIFLTRLLVDGNWTEPINLGPAINSGKDEGGLFVDLLGEYAYYSKTSKEDGKIQSDIYRFILPQSMKPTAVTYVKFNIVDGETNKRISAKLNLLETETKTNQEITISSNGTVLIIEQEKSYAIEVEKQDYTFHSEKIDVETHPDKSKPLIYDIVLFPLKTMAKKDTLPPVSLKNLTFETGKAEIIVSSFPELNRLVKLLQENPTVSVLLNAHTDNVGNEEDNLILSRRRAESVKNYLLDQEIAVSRISTNSLGESQPIQNNDTVEGRAANRRIEFQIINSN